MRDVIKYCEDNLIKDNSYKSKSELIFEKKSGNKTLRVLIMGSCYDVDVYIGEEIGKAFMTPNHLYHAGGRTLNGLLSILQEAKEKL